MKKLEKNSFFPILIPEKHRFYVILPRQWKNLRLGKEGIDLPAPPWNFQQWQCNPQYNRVGMCLDTLKVCPSLG